MRLKKLLVRAAISAAVIVLAVSPVAADVTPSGTDSASITVTNVEHGATVKAYKIVNAEYSAAGLNGYEPASGVAIADLENPTLSEIQTVTVDIQNGALSLPVFDMIDVTPSDTHSLGDGSTACTYRSEGVGAGMYLIMVKGVSGNVYNPAIVSVGYDSSSQITSGLLNISEGRWTVSGETAEVKHSGVTVSKDTKDGIRSYCCGDTVSYEVTAAIPGYDSSVYSDAVFRLVDTADEGLTFDKDSVSVVNAAGSQVSSANYTVSLNGQTLTVDFDSDWVLINGGTSVKVCYDATLNEGAALDFDGNYNRVKIVYSNDPTIEGGAVAYDDPENPGMPKAEAVVYTFDFSFKKVDSKDPELYLPGAVFSLTGTNSTGDTVSYTETSSENGIIHFKGLSEGTYTMTETKAPDGYAVNRNEYTVTVSASYGPDKTLTSYTISVSDQDGTSFMNSTYTVTPGADGSDGSIPNTAFLNLPATGGTGTVIFSLAGLTAVTAATVLLMKKRKGSEA